MTTGLAVLAVASLLKLGAFPIARRALSPLPHAGIGFSATLGLLLVGVPLWFLASVPVLSYTRLSAWLAMLALLTAGGVQAWRGKVRPDRADRSVLLLAEAVFVLTFLLGLFIVGHAPAIWGGEKPLDMSLIQSSLNAQHFPPGDPSLSGYSLDYYYYLGQFLISVVIRLSGVDSVEGYNACVALVWALGASAAYGLGAMVAGLRGSRRRAQFGGLAAAALMVLGGNAASARLFIANGLSLAGYPWFTPSRVIPDTPNDFPSFDAVFGELHAHVIAVPVTILALAFAFEVLTVGPRFGLGVLLPALVAGSLLAINAWSVPVVFGLLAAAVVLSGAPARRAVGWLALLGLGAAISYAPYLLTLTPSGSQGIGVVHGWQPLGRYLRHLAGLYGLALLPIAAWVVVRTPRTWRRWAAGAIIVVLVIAAVLDVGPVVLGVVGLLGTLAVLRRQHEPAVRYALLLSAAGLACVLLPEIVYLRDGNAGTSGYRANTVFKLGVNGFVLLSASAAILLVELARPTRLWRTVVGVLVLGLAIFPVAGGYARTNGFAGSTRLDGLQWLSAIAPGDPGAISWLRSHAPSKAVLVEAVGPKYSLTGRMSVFTGRSAVVQYPNFLRFYGRGPLAERREHDVRQLYETPSPAQASRLLARYGVDYVIVGPLERATYPRLQEPKLSAAADLVYAKQGTAVYRVTR